MPGGVLVLGGGAAGTACAIHAAAQGVRVTLVDGGGGAGLAGTLAKRHLADLVAAAATATPDLFDEFRHGRRRVLAEAAAQRRRRLAERGVRVLDGHARLEAVAPLPRLRVGEAEVATERLVLAVGARPRLPAWCGPGTPATSPDALYLGDDPLPERLAVLGGGWAAVGVAGLFRALGVEVTLVFAEAEPLAGFDDDLRAHVGATLAAAGVRLRPHTRVSAVTAGERRHAVETDAGVVGADRVVVAGDEAAVPNTDGLDLDRFGVALTPQGAVYVDTRYASRTAGLFAVGDCADHAGHGLAPGTFDYASVAAEEGRRLAGHLAGAPPAPLDYELQPLIVPGRPELATLGLAEARARGLGFPVAGRGRTRPDGRFAKLVVDADTGDVVGCHLAGPGAGAALGRVAATLEVAPAIGPFARELRARGPAGEPFGEELVAQARELG